MCVCAKGTFHQYISDNESFKVKIKCQGLFFQLLPVNWVWLVGCIGV